MLRSSDEYAERFAKELLIAQAGEGGMDGGLSPTLFSMTMKTAFLLLCATAFVLLSSACDKHSWEETKGLHEGMHKDHGGSHGDAHAAPDAHGEKKAEH
jgi:hypothetical protein